MTLSRRARLILAMPVLALVGFPALVLWGAGWVIMFTGQNLWMICHRRFRAPGCACEECVQFDGVPAPVRDMVPPVQQTAEAPSAP